MDQGLFGKYVKVLVQRKNILDEIIEYTQQETGVILNSMEIIISKKTISFQTSSVKKVLLRKKSIEDFLKKKGYTLKNF